MKNTELFDILGSIDDKFYDEALGGDSERPMQIRIKNPAFSIKNVVVPVAACLAVAAGIGVTAHFLNKAGFVDPNVTTSSDTVSDVSLFNPNITDADIAECKALLKDRYPNIDEYMSEDISAYYFRAADIDFDGCDEVLIVANDKNYSLFIFDKTPDGMVETAQLDEFDQDYIDLSNIHRYEADGERYWYYYDTQTYELPRALEEYQYRLYAKTLARIKFEDGEYSIDHPLCYGYSYENIARDEPEEWFFRIDWSNISEPAEMPVSNITPEEFKEKWNAHTELPGFCYYTNYEEEYPMFDIANVPVIDPYRQPERRLPKTVFDVKDMGGYELWLIGSEIYQHPGEDPEIVSVGSLSLALVKDGKLIPSIEGFGCFISSANDGFSHFCLDTNLLDKYIRNIFTLEDGTPIIEIRYQRADNDKFGVESLFFGVKNDALYRLYSKDCGYDVGDLGELTVDGNSLIDIENAVKYEFNPDAFEGNPFEVPHFTKTEFIPEGDYPMYNGQAAPQATLCEKKLNLDNGTVKLLALDAKPVTKNGIEYVEFSKLFLRADFGSGSGWVKPVNVPGSLPVSKLDECLVPILFNAGKPDSRELIAVFYGTDKVSKDGRKYDIAVFHSAANGEPFHMDRSQSGAIIPSGDPCELGEFTVHSEGYMIDLKDDPGRHVIFDFESYQFIYGQE